MIQIVRRCQVAAEDNKFVSRRLDISIVDGRIAAVKRKMEGHLFQTRAESTLKMLLDALIGLNGKVPITANIVIDIGDFPKQTMAKNHFYYCVDHIRHVANAIPDFPFESWKQAGIENYTDTVAQIARQGAEKWQSDKLFWIGNSKMHANRRQFLTLATENPERIEAVDTRVDRAVAGRSLPYVSLPDHTRYKYLIDIEGAGYSGRIPFLLHSQRVLFIQERRWKAYYHFELEPYKHFIPVKNDLSDLLEQLEFVESQGEAYYREIAANALAFAREKLTYRKAVEVLQQRLVACAETNN